MTIRTGYPYQTLKFWTAGQHRARARPLEHLRAATDREQRTNQTYGLMMVRKPDMPGLMHLMWPVIVWFTNGIFAQDRPSSKPSSAPTMSWAATTTRKSSRSSRS